MMTIPSNQENYLDLKHKINYTKKKSINNIKFYNKNLRNSNCKLHLFSKFFLNNRENGQN